MSRSIQSSRTFSGAEHRGLYPLQYYGSTPPGVVFSRIGAMLKNDDLVMLVINALPKPVFPGVATVESAQSKAARLDLYDLARASTDFFYPAMREAWKILPDVKMLVKTLHIGVPELNSKPWRTYRAIELNLLQSVERMIPSQNAQSNILYNHFRYYAACPRRIKVCSGNYLELLLGYVQHLMPSDTDFFQSLEELFWLETAGCFEPRTGNISQFLRAPQLTSVFLQFADPLRLSLAHLIDNEDQRIYAEIVMQVGGEVSSIRPNLSHLTLSVPVFVQISPSVLRGFTGVQNIVLQMNIGGGDPVGAVRVSQLNNTLCSPRRLELLWTQESDFGNLPENVSFRALKTLLIRSLDYPTSTFVPQITQLAFATTEHLTTVEVFCVDHKTLAINCGEFVRFVSPLLSRRRLQRLTAVLHGYSFELSASDLDVLAGAWPALEVLNISFHLEHKEVLPNMHHVLYVLCKRCPRLSYLHLPGLATPPGEGAIPIPHFPTSPLYHISSDVFIGRHNPMDLAHGLLRSFPRLMELGPPGVTTSSWTDIQELLQYQRSRDFAPIFEHTSMLLRNGTYPHVPLSFCCMMVSELFNRLEAARSSMPQSVPQHLIDSLSSEIGYLASLLQRDGMVHVGAPGSW